MTTALELIHGDPECEYKHFTAKVGEPINPDADIDVECFMTTDVVDSDDEVMLPNGIDLTRYAKNPVVMLCHAMGQPGCFYPLPVGKALWTKQARRGVLAGVRFARDTEMGRQVKSLFDEGMLRSFSVGFRPLEASGMTRKEAESRPDWQEAYERTKGQVRVHRKWSLIELSVAPIPSNPDALVTTYKAKGILVPAWLNLKRDATVKKESACFDIATKTATKDAQGVSSADVTPADARVMIGLWIPPETASGLVVDGGESADELHLTLCYLGRAIEIGTNAIDRVKRMCESLASYSSPLVGSMSGVGRFSASSTSDGQDVVYASADIPGLAEFRQRLAYELEGMGVAYSKAHGFTPHVTLSYVAPEAESPVKRIQPTPVVFDRFCLVVDGEKTFFPLAHPGIGYGGPSVAWRAASDLVRKSIDEEDKATCDCDKAECDKCQERMRKAEEEADDKEADETEADDEDDVESKAMEADDFDEDDESELPIKTRDHVDVKSKGYHGPGVVEKIYRRGMVEHVDDDVMGSKDDPAARVRCYKAHGDGHKACEHRVGVKLKSLSRRAEPLKEPSRKSADEIEAKAKALEPLPPLIALSEDEVQQEALKQIPSLVDAAINKLLGVV